MSKKDDDNVSLDSGYGSDNDSMAVANEVSQVATEKIKDIDALIGKLGRYKETFDAKTYADEILQFNEAFMSVIEGLAAENFRENLSDEKIQQLVDTIALNSKLCSKFISDKQKLDTLKLKAARTEGALKGFVLPLKERDVSIKTINYELEKEEYKIPMEATKKALLELQGQKLAKVEYANKVVARTMEILEQDERNFSAEKLQQFKNFVQKGDKSLTVKNDQLITKDDKLSKLPQFDQNEISNAAIKSVDAFIKELETENKKAENTSPGQGRQLVPQKSMPQQDILQRVSFGEQKTKDLQASKEMVSSIIDKSIKQLKLKVPTNTAEKIKSNLSPILSKFDPQFLQKNETDIITNITHEITQDKTSFSELRKEVHIASDKVKKIAQKITKEYAEQNNQFIEEKIKPLLNIKKDELALRLSTFIQENQISLSSVNEMLGLSENNKINSDAKSLSLTDKQVEHITVKQLNGLIRVNPIGFNRNLFQEIPAEVKSVNVETEKVQQHNF
ncbi:MAG: hypothetical protein LN569_00070 [Rickettsia endosymbiont of Labidopullus appendiculatus]|nr:hypothetical protein [Rickettsia endosymbiont of Labidopullus appendiculatus]